MRSIENSKETLKLKSHEIKYYFKIKQLES